MRLLSKILVAFFDLLFPKLCLGCKKEDSYLCQSCFNDLKVDPNGRILLAPLEIVFVCCKNSNLLRDIIHQLKYGYMEELSRPLGFLMARRLSECALEDDFTVVPVPLHARRFRERDFNQSELLTREIEKYFGLPVQHALCRIRFTKPQAGLLRHERLVNLKDAFAVCENVCGQNILLVDDVCTTGSTLRECAKVLKIAGAKKVVGVVLSHGI